MHRYAVSYKNSGIHLQPSGLIFYEKSAKQHLDFADFLSPGCFLYRSVVRVGVYYNFRSTPIPSTLFVLVKVSLTVMPPVV